MSWKLLQKREIPDPDGSPYLVRITLVETPWFSVKLHHILQS